MSPWDTPREELPSRPRARRLIDGGSIRPALRGHILKDNLDMARMPTIPPGHRASFPMSAGKGESSPAHRWAVSAPATTRPSRTGGDPGKVEASAASRSGHDVVCG